MSAWHDLCRSWSGAQDTWSPEARKAAAESRHLHMHATPASGSGKGFKSEASNKAEVEKHLSGLHAHIKKNNLETHNVAIHNTKTGEVHHAKVNAAAGIYKRTYTNL